MASRAQWQDLSDKQKKAFGGDKKAFKDSKKATAKSGGDASSVKSIKTTHRAPSPSPSPSPSSSPQSRPTPVAKIDDYVTTNYGAGAHKGGDRLSRSDLKELEKQGFSHQQIIDYSARKTAGATKQGGKAQSLLNKWKSALTQSPAPTPAPEEAPKKVYDQRPQNVTQTINSGDGVVDYARDYENIVRDRPEFGLSPINPNIGRPRPRPGSDGQGGININQEANIEQSNTQTFEVNQDNDINTNISGDGNTVYNNQDNSVRNYGGNQSNTAYVNQSADGLYDYNTDTPDMDDYYSPSDYDLDRYGTARSRAQASRRSRSSGLADIGFDFNGYDFDPSESIGRNGRQGAYERNLERINSLGM